MLRALVSVPILILIVLFALSNTDPVRVGLWPTDFNVFVPLSLAVLAGMGLAFVLGGLFVWVTALAQRHRARRAESQVRALENQVTDLKARLQQTTATPVLPPLPPPV